MILCDIRVGGRQIGDQCQPSGYGYLFYLVWVDIETVFWSSWLITWRWFFYTLFKGFALPWACVCGAIYFQLLLRLKLQNHTIPVFLFFLSICNSYQQMIVYIEITSVFSVWIENLSINTRYGVLSLNNVFSCLEYTMLIL